FAPCRNETAHIPGLSLDLEIHRRCFPAVLFDLILDVLPFIEGGQSSALDCGDVDEHILAACLLNESIALGRIEPLHRAARHCRSPCACRKSDSAILVMKAAEDRL